VEKHARQNSVRTRGTSRVAAAFESLEARRLLATLAGGFNETVIATLGGSPTAMAFTPDGRLLAAQEDGNLRVVKNNTLLTTPALTVATDTFSERGLLGVAVHPNFASNGWIYTYHTNATTEPVRLHVVTRWTMSGDTVVAGSGVQMFTIPMGSAGNHNGGALNFGPDGKLYIAVGDSGPVPSQPQGLETVYGKILRINDDGAIPTDNPFYFQATGDRRAIWALGLRNPFTFAFQPGTGRMFINDVGSSGTGRREEVNPGFAGANYGWPRVEGFRTTQTVSDLTGVYTDPVHAYNTGGQAITGGVFYNPATANFPAAYVGDYFFGDYVSGTIRTLDASSSSAPYAATNFATAASGPVDFDVAADGSLWYLEYTSRQIRRVVVNTSSSPVINNQPASQTVSIGQPVTFSVVAGGPNLSYQWRRGTTDIPGATGPSYTLDNPQFADTGATFSVRVSNTNGNVTSNAATLTVLNNQLPNATFTNPSTALRFVGGQSVSFAATATDPEDGTLPASAFTWEVQYITGAAAPRPYVPATSGVTSGSFTPATLTPYTDPDVAYRIVLTVRDSAGATRTFTRDVLPDTSVVSIGTAGAPVPLPVLFDGTQRSTPFSFTGVAGVIRQLEAPASQVVDGQTYQFQGWSNGGSRQQSLSTPVDDATITATYLDVTAPRVTGTTFVFDQSPQRLRVTFSEAIPTPPAAGFTLLNTTTNTAVPVTVAFDAATRVATLSFPAAVLADGNYTLSFNTAQLADAAGNALANAPAVQFHFFRGDMNRDGTLNNLDIAPFVQALTAPAGFESQFGFNPAVSGDVNNDGAFNNLDIAPFVALLTGGPSTATSATAGTRAASSPRAVASLLSDGEARSGRLSESVLR
jgi:glucose/arabinose dehydrogenase